jgi:hypothetical protein
MRIVVEIPDSLARPLILVGEDPARAALEALGLEAYRQRRITGFELRSLLGIASRYELDGFLKQHEVYDFTVADFEKDLASIGESTDERAAERRA